MNMGTPELELDPGAEHVVAAVLIKVGSLVPRGEFQRRYGGFLIEQIVDSCINHGFRPKPVQSLRNEHIVVKGRARVIRRHNVGLVEGNVPRYLIADIEQFPPNIKQASAVCESCLELMLRTANLTGLDVLYGPPPVLRWLKRCDEQVGLLSYIRPLVGDSSFPGP